MSEERYTSEIEEIDEITKKVSIVVTAKEVEDEYKKAIQRYSQSAKVKGFRQGKVPVEIIEKMYGKGVESEICSQLISGTLNEFIREKELNVVGTPDVDVETQELGKDLTYSAKLDLYPSPEIAGYDKINVSVEKGEVEDSDVETVVQNLLKSKATTKPREENAAVQDGDVIEALISVTLEGEEPGAAEPATLPLGDNRLPEEIEKELVGMKPGDEKAIDFTIPETHQDPKLHGKVATYNVSLTSVMERVIPDLTDDLVKELGYEGVETALELKVDIRKRLEEEQEGKIDNEVLKELLDVLLDKNEFKVPQALVDDEIRSTIARSGMVDPQKIDVRQIPVDPFRERFGDEATKRVRTSVIIDQVAGQEDIKAEESDLDAYFAKVAEDYRTTAEEVKKVMMAQDRAFTTMLEVTRDKVFKFLRDRTEVKYSKPK